MIWLFCAGVAIAEAQGQGKIQPFMSGWGVSAHTTLIPLEYPQSFPKIKSGESTNFQQVGQDLALGVKGTMFSSRKYRASFNPYYHIGFNESNYRSLGLNLELDKVAVRERNVWAYYGLGGGTSNIKFVDPNEATLTATQLYLKGQAGAMYFDRTKAYELSAFVTFGTTGREQISKDSTVYENNGLLGGDDQLKGSLYYPTIGLQGTVYRGNFRKALNNGNNQNKKKKSKKGKKK